MKKFQMLLVLAAAFFAVQGQVAAEEPAVVVPIMGTQDVVEADAAILEGETKEVVKEGDAVVEEGTEEVKKLEGVQI